VIAASVWMMRSSQTPNARADNFVNDLQINRPFPLALILQTPLVLFFDPRPQRFQQLDAGKPFEIVEWQLRYLHPAIFPEGNFHFLNFQTLKTPLLRQPLPVSRLLLCATSATRHALHPFFCPL